MNRLTSFATSLIILISAAMPVQLLAQTTHVIMVKSNFFDPAEITIEAGDTVHWVNEADGGFHNVIAEDLSFASGSVTDSWEYQHTFTEAGENPYYCQPHRLGGMTGNITVTGSVGGGGSGVDINPGHNGNWWNGLDRNGEGAQVEIADAGNDELVFVVTVYSYGPQGGQIFLIGVGTPDGEAVDVDIFITEGGMWGDDFDPNDVDQPQWGTGTFTSGGCDLISMVLTPNSTYQAQGYTELAYDLVRLTTPAIACPYEE